MKAAGLIFTLYSQVLNIAIAIVVQTIQLQPVFSLVPFHVGKACSYTDAWLF